VIVVLHFKFERLVTQKFPSRYYQPCHITMAHSSKYCDVDFLLSSMTRMKTEGGADRNRTIFSQMLLYMDAAEIDFMRHIC
jgi:hypothetical protein